MKIVAAGISGFIGTALVAALREHGHEVVQLVRRTPGGPDQRQWNPDTADLDRTVLQGAEAVINLCGVGVGDKRWNDAFRALIVSSRTRPTALLARACAEYQIPTLLNASAIGYYGHRGDETVDESADSGTDFFSAVVRDWEAATAAAVDGGTRVVNLRSGLVVGRNGGLLPKLALTTKLFAGGRLGSGKQYFSWVSLPDEVAAIEFLLTADLAGPVNVTSPNPVRNAEFVGAVGDALHRPTPWIVPGFALHLALGDFADDVLHGQRVVPAKLQAAGFEFRYPQLPEALRAELH